MSDMPSDYMQGTVILNNSNIAPEFIQEQYSFIPNSVKVDLFDKESWRPTTRSPYIDELENYDGKNLWLNLWHVMKEQPYQFVVNKEQLQNFYHFRTKLYTTASQLEIQLFVLFTKKDIIERVLDKVQEDNENRIRQELQKELDFEKEIKRFPFNEIVYVESDSDVNKELYEKIVNIYNEIK